MWNEYYWTEAYYSRRDHNFSTRLPYANKKFKEFYLSMVISN